jgi:ribosomal protein S18 acetylase RimI-like enzyme
MPTAPLSRAELAAIEDAGLQASAAPGQRLVDGWLLRFSPGKAKRARCVNALEAGRLALDDKIGLCEQAYAETGLPMIVRVTPLSKPADLDDALARVGLRRFDDTRVMVLPQLQPPGATPAVEGTAFESISGAALAQLVGGLRGSSPAQRSAHAERLALAPAMWRSLALRRSDGETLACGQVAVAGELAGLYDIFTAPPARGRGFARALCAQLLSLAHAAGARRAYLQVEADNQPARAVYHGLGFADAYAYHYRTRDALAA